MGAATLVATTVLVVAGVPVIHDVGNAILVLDTLSAAVSLLAALLVFGRFRRSSQLSDVALVWAFFTLAAGNLLAAYLDPPSRMTLLSGVLSAIALLIAAAQERSVSWGGGRLGAALAGVVVPVLALVGFVTVGDEVASGGSRLVILLITATCFGVGAVAFTAQGDRERDPLLMWVGGGCVIAAASRLLYAMTAPPTGVEVHPADIGRFLFVACLGVGAVLEIRSYWFGVAALEERRRIARELHDGMAQELATIVTATRRMSREGAGPPDAIGWYRISRAAERALDESRRAIHALISPMDQPLDVAVAATAEDVAAREGAEVSLDLTENVRVTGEVREALVRIVREAVANAARHGQAGLIAVDLKVGTDGDLRLRVSDDGCGFATTTPVGNGRVGLMSMKERAAAVGGSLSVTSSPGGGTSVEVRVPSLN